MHETRAPNILIEEFTMEYQKIIVKYLHTALHVSFLGLEIEKLPSKRAVRKLQRELLPRNVLVRTWCNVSKLMGDCCTGIFIPPALEALDVYIDLLDVCYLTEGPSPNCTSFKEYNQRHGAPAEILIHLLQRISASDRTYKTDRYEFTDVAADREKYDMILIQNIPFFSFYVLKLAETGHTEYIRDRLSRPESLQAMQAAATSLSARAREARIGSEIRNILACAALGVQSLRSHIVWKVVMVEYILNTREKFPLLETLKEIPPMMESWMEAEDALGALPPSSVPEPLCWFYAQRLAALFLGCSAKTIAEAARDDLIYCDHRDLILCDPLLRTIESLATFAARLPGHSQSGNPIREEHAMLISQYVAFFFRGLDVILVDLGKVFANGNDEFKHMAWELGSRAAQACVRASMAWVSLSKLDIIKLIASEEPRGDLEEMFSDVGTMCISVPEMLIYNMHQMFPGSKITENKERCQHLAALTLLMLHGCQMAVGLYAGGPVSADYDISAHSTMIIRLYQLRELLGDVLFPSEFLGLSFFEAHIEHYFNQDIHICPIFDKTELFTSLEGLRMLAEKANHEERSKMHTVARAELLATLQCSYLGCSSAKKADEEKLRSKLCSGCRKVRYCSPQCQKKEWKAHKAACKELLAAKEQR